MQKVKLGEICEITMGQSPESQYYNVLAQGLPFFQGNADFGDRHPIVRVWCTNPKKTSDVGAILMSVRAPIGALNLVNVKCAIGRGLVSIKPNSRCMLKYLWYALKSKVEVLKSMGTGSTFKAISKPIVEELEIPLPPIEEQRAIAEKLDKVSQLVDKRKEQLQQLDQLVKSQFIDMFGDQQQNSKHFKAYQLQTLCDIYRGGSPRPIEKYLGGNVPWIKIGDATEDDSVYLKSTKQHICESGVKKSRLVKKGSLIFANCGVSLGFARIITFDGCIHDGWLSFENINLALNPIFFLYSLNISTDYFRMIAPAGTQPNLNTKIMKEHFQIVPPIELQNQFAEFVERVDKLKEKVNNSLTQLNLLKQSLMQQYFG